MKISRDGDAIHCSIHFHFHMWSSYLNACSQFEKYPQLLIALVSNR